MGGFTSNRKRGDEYLSFNHGISSPYAPSPYSQTSKRPRFLSTSMKQETLVSSKSAMSRVSRYPDAKPPLTRIHAPCRNHRFGLSSGPKRPATRDGESGSEQRGLMGTRFFLNLKVAKDLALGAFRFVGKEKEPVAKEPERLVEDEVVVVVEESDDDSGVEEIEVIEDDDGDRGTHVEQRNVGSVRPELSDDVAKVGPSLSLDVGRARVLAYQKLLEESNSRTPKLERLRIDIELNELRRNQIQSLRPVKKLVEEIPCEPFVPLTKEEEMEVKQAFSANRKKVLVSHQSSNIEITGQVLQCLRPGAWLNDEVINLYLELMKEREKREPKKYLKCHFFNTFFYKKLTVGGGYDYKAVRRWTTQRKLGYSLADCEKIFVPIHREIHWCLAVINKAEEKFQYLDSLGGVDGKILHALSRYYADEVKDKTGKEINVSTWKHEFVEDLPEQLNGYDCGVFMIKYADFYSRGLRLCFGQEHMPYFRLRTAKEILRLRAE